MDYLDSVDGGASIKNGLALASGLERLASSHEIDKRAARQQVDNTLIQYFLDENGQPVMNPKQLSDAEIKEVAKDIYKTRIAPEGCTVVYNTIAKKWDVYVKNYGATATVQVAVENVEIVGDKYKIKGEIEPELKERMESCQKRLKEIKDGKVPEKLAEEKTEQLLKILTKDLKDDGYFKVSEFKETLKRIAKKYKDSFGKYYAIGMQKELLKLMSENQTKFKKYVLDIVDKIAKSETIDPVEKLRGLAPIPEAMEQQIPQLSSAYRKNGLEEAVD